MTTKDLGIEPPVRRSLAQLVAQQLLDRIRDGSLAPGEKLPSEAALKEHFQVGRSTIREALNGLVLIGAIDVRHGHGAVVRGEGPPQSDALDAAVSRAVTRELLDARGAMEIAIARFAAERASDEDLDALRELLLDAERTIASGKSAAKQAARFHLLLAEAAQNEVCRQFIEMILDKLQERGVDLSQSEGYDEWEVAAHRAVLDAVSSGVAERAERAMARHLEDMRAIAIHGWDTFRLRTIAY
ncbi:MAG: GntR family transcriptional regulator, transcriptional repressor for pyruvate dehydrogenase complex [Solirubrobacteraceae bacterium]|jgi:GntR family transcriptional repressor for pyruvate dehydrogenase complex|nr:GntR family transcriptional regulator, transcriptional repressor for pyruvate dehydrogenase complex [Solirubrobacteraceae bacterium]